MCHLYNVFSISGGASGVLDRANLSSLVIPQFMARLVATVILLRPLRAENQGRVSVQEGRVITLVILSRGNEFSLSRGLL